jgi:putative heme-binding domain-containing protein
MIKKVLLFLPGIGLWLAIAALSSDPVIAQHSYTAAQIEDGRNRYDANCGRCHNNTGDGVAGVALFKEIKRASTDDDIAKLIQQGIPGTAMPPHSFTDEQAHNVVAFLRSMVGVAPAGATASGLPSMLPPGRSGGSLAGGDAARGKEIFNGKGGCASCHRADGAGGQTGPDLSAIGQVRPTRGFDSGVPNVAQIERSIRDPQAEIAPKYRVYQVVTRSGQTIKGTLLNQDTFSVQMMDDKQQLRGFLKSDLKEWGFQPSPMPAYQGRLSPQEMADLLTYLLTLKG